MSVRHGVMNVGLTMTAKSTVINVLAGALGEIRKFLNTRPDLTKEKYNDDAFPLF